MTGLFDALDQDPTDLQSWLVYADRLNENGDPRGELIAIDLALHEATPESHPRLLAQREHLYATHGPKLLGPLGSKAVENGFLEVEWRHGFVTSAIYPGAPNWRHRRPVSWMLKVLSEEPYRFTRRIELPYTDISAVDLLPWRHLEQLNVRASLVQDLTGLSRFDKLGHLDVSGIRLDNVEALVELRQLHTLEIGSFVNDLDDLKAALPHLRIIEHDQEPYYG